MIQMSNIVLIGSSSLRRNAVKKFLSELICPVRYVFHSYETEPTTRKWEKDAAAVFLFDATELKVPLDQHKIFRNGKKYSLVNILNID